MILLSLHFQSNPLNLHPDQLGIWHYEQLERRRNIGIHTAWLPRILTGQIRRVVYSARVWLSCRQWGNMLGGDIRACDKRHSFIFRSARNRICLDICVCTFRKRDVDRWHVAQTDRRRRFICKRADKTLKTLHLYSRIAFNLPDLMIEVGRNDDFALTDIV